MLKGYSLIEILIIIVLLSLLTLYALRYFYLPYTEKSSLAVNSFPILKNCLYDIISFCVTHPGLSFNKDMLSNCQPRNEIYGNITFEVPNATCTLDGQLPLGYEVKAFSTASDKFYAVCRYNKGGIRCFISPK